MLKKGFAILLYLTVSTSGAFAQDIAFSQFFAAPMNVNPAFAGIAFGPRIIFNYRNQWPTMQNAFETYAVTYDQHIDALSGGIGINLLADEAGDGIYQRIEASAVYSYQVNINRKAIVKTGLQGKFVQSRLNWDRVILPDMLNILDANLLASSEPGPVANELTYFDFAAGALVYSENVFGGAAVSHIMSPKESFVDDKENKIPMRITGHIGGSLNLSRNPREKFYMAPNLVYAWQGGFHHMNVGTIINRQNMFGGLWFRHTITNFDAVTLLVGMSRNVFKVGYSYDITASSLGTATGGAHEVSLILNFAKAGQSVINRRQTVPIPSPVFL